MKTLNKLVYRYSLWILGATLWYAFWEGVNSDLRIILGATVFAGVMILLDTILKNRQDKRTWTDTPIADQLDKEFGIER